MARARFSLLTAAILSMGTLLRAQEVPRAVVISFEKSSIYEAILEGFQKGAPFTYDLFRDPEAFIETARKRDYKVIIAVGMKTFKTLPENVDIPIVVTGVPNFFDDELAKNVVRVHLDFPAKLQLSLLRELSPKAKSVGMVYMPERSEALAGQAQEALSQAGYAFHPEKCQNAKDLTPALDRLAGKIDVLWVMLDPLLLSNSTLFEATSFFCIQNKILMVAPTESCVRAGAVLGIGADYHKLGVLTSEAAGDILKGSPPKRDYFLDKPSIFVNRHSAERLGLAVPPALVKRVEKFY